MTSPRFLSPSGQLSLEAEKTWLQYESERWGLKFNLEGSTVSLDKAAVYP